MWCTKSQSIGNKTLSIHDLITENDLDILVVTETQLKNYDAAEICEMMPVTHTFLHVLREARRGGGVGVFFQALKKIWKKASERWGTYCGVLTSSLKSRGVH